MKIFHESYGFNFFKENYNNINEWWYDDKPRMLEFTFAKNMQWKTRIN